MAFYIETLCFESIGGYAIKYDRDGHPIEKHWRKVRPTNGEPYQYATKQEAETYARLCGDNVRVVED